MASKRFFKQLLQDPSRAIVNKTKEDTRRKVRSTARKAIFGDGRKSKSSSSNVGCGIVIIIFIIMGLLGRCMGPSDDTQNDTQQTVEPQNDTQQTGNQINEKSN